MLEFSLIDTLFEYGFRFLIPIGIAVWGSRACLMAIRTGFTLPTSGQHIFDAAGFAGTNFACIVAYFVWYRNFWSYGVEEGYSHAPAFLALVFFAGAVWIARLLHYMGLSYVIVATLYFILIACLCG